MSLEQTNLHKAALALATTMSIITEGVTAYSNIKNILEKTKREKRDLTSEELMTIVGETEVVQRRVMAKLKGSMNA